MSSFAKSKLKAARDAIGKKKYEQAREAAAQVLDYEPDNYTAHVFLGLAFLELGQHEQSEQLYRKAIELKDDQVLAWQGIAKLYEQTHRWNDLADTLEHIMQIFAKNDDAMKCAETLQKFMDIRRQHGTRREVIQALFLYLPDSSLYPVLSSLPPPDATNPTSTSIFPTQSAIHNSLDVYEELISLTEREEEMFMKSEFDKRRTRLGGPKPEQLRKDIGIEVWHSSKLPALYNEILNHPSTSDELRRATESKLIRYKQQLFMALPSTDPEKRQVGTQLDEMVNGIVTIGIPDEFAWCIWLEGRDSDTVEGVGLPYLKEFIELFPTSTLALMLKGYFIYSRAAHGDEGFIEEMTVDGDPYNTILDAFSALPDSLLANMITARVHLQELEYTDAIKVAESGLELVRRYESNTARELREVRKAFHIILSTSFVHLFPPKHHPRALYFLNDVLTQDPTNVDGLMGKGYVFQRAEKWEEAEMLFSQAAKQLPDDMDKGLEAKEESAWCLSRMQLDAGADALKEVFEILKDIEDRDIDKARCLWRIGRCYWDLGGESREEAFKHFITSLKHNREYAPAYTSLGVYYSEHASPPDPTRASKCFQKAFELDAREAEAARRLAEGFADEREWDLVEVVARRTIDGEGGMGAGMEEGDGAASGKYLPTNAWAWKALGVVELTRRNYPESIKAFQVALRADVDDQLSWLRLGEAYSKAGRHVAALRALGRAHELQPDDWMCTYFIGEVQRQAGRLAEALASFQSILDVRPTEAGTLLSIAQTHLDLARHERFTGFVARAEQSFVSCVDVVLVAIRESPGYRGVAWKIAADALFELSVITVFADEANVRAVVTVVCELVQDQSSARLAGLFKPTSFSSDDPISGLNALEAAVAAYDYRITVGSSDEAALPSSLYDLAVALHEWILKQPPDTTQQASEAANSLLIQALQKEPGNVRFWVALGDLHFANKPKLSQHAYIKAIEVDNKNVVAWTKIGLLYLYHNDIDLATQAFTKAQTLDPDHTLAWIGQALIATANGHEADARTLLEHAVSMTADVPMADLQFASRVLAAVNDSNTVSAPTTDRLLPAFFVLGRYFQRCPVDACGLHIFGLICERLGKLEQGVEYINRAITLLEAAYEEKEDPVIERQFIIAHTNIARLRLGLQDYEGSLASFETALGLLPEDAERETQILRVQAQYGSGLASFKMGDLEIAMTAFQDALESAAEDRILRGQVTVLLAQTMWAIGTPEFRESAKGLLLECITSDPENLMAINTLAGMGILTEDDGLVDAALSEILSLPIEQRHVLDPQRDVTYLLVQHYLGLGDSARAAKITQIALHVEPSNVQIRREVASLLLRQGDRDAASAILASVAPNQNVEEEKTTLALSALAQPIQSQRRAQKAIMLEPGQLRNWQTLAYVQAQEAL
ncbi:superkiller protein 3 [Suillus clintonianus]|uniref:superkiller protein 3 n=1 Tax=Suillus clintonianus TaxID=1904413 RepID=UPI001B868E9A|nr:superkiller protein 3 [Suillus clintonianus]KAG2153913.1 superkiller protein 3 [Suillus clintonianus]